MTNRKEYSGNALSRAHAEKRRLVMAKATKRPARRATGSKRAKASAKKKSASKGTKTAKKSSSKASPAKAALHVIIYTTQTCPFCKLAKELLQSKHVSFTERDVLQDRHFAKEMIKKSSQMGVPVLDINGHIVIGFDKEAILKAITR
jgi:glutaredoxin 3